jgi:hypothetical protein
MARRGDGIYRRGRVWYFDAVINGTRYVEKIGRGINRTVAAEIAQVKRAAILRGEVGIRKQKPKPLDIAFDDASRAFLAWVATNRKPGTVVFYTNCLAILARTFGGKKLSEINLMDIEQYKRSRVTGARGQGGGKSGSLELMGHRDIKMTLRYTHVSNRHTRTAVRAALVPPELFPNAFHNSGSVATSTTA